MCIWSLTAAVDQGPGDARSSTPRSGILLVSVAPVTSGPRLGQASLRHLSGLGALTDVTVARAGDNSDMRATRSSLHALIALLVLAPACTTELDVESDLAVVAASPTAPTSSAPPRPRPCRRPAPAS